jgi:branched-chain amino acid transport system permease protein
MATITDTPTVRRASNLNWVDVILNVLRVLIIALIIIGASNTLLSGRFTFEQWVTLFIAGLAQGSIYALIALGYTLVYGILLMINFAHGEVFMAGAFTTVFLAKSMASSGFLDAQPILAFILLLMFGGLVSMTVAVLLERIAYRPLRNSPRLVPLITAIGASFFLQYTFRGFYGSSFQAYPTFSILSGSIQLGTVNIPIVQVFVFVMALILMAGLYYLVERTKIGKAMRAVSENKQNARLMGINVDLIILFTFAIGGALAGAAGVINGVFRPQGVNFFMGFIPGIKAFTAAVLGGIGSIPGAMFGGLLLGVIEAIGPNLVLIGLGIPGANQLRDLIAFGMLVLILIFRPQGLLGEKLAEKKA